jgi:predicted proteasome-type protease
MTFFSYNYFNEPIKFDDTNVSINSTLKDNIDNSWSRSLKMYHKDQFNLHYQSISD